VFVDMDTGEIEELKDVMYHEKSNDNIISEGQWAKDNAGYEFVVRGEDHLIVKPGQPPRRTRKIGNHGILRARPLNATEKKKYLRDRYPMTHNEDEVALLASRLHLAADLMMRCDVCWKQGIELHNATALSILGSEYYPNDDERNAINEDDVATRFYVTTPDCYIVDRDDLEMWILYKIGVFCWNDDAGTHALYDDEMEYVENDAVHDISSNKHTLDEMIQCPCGVMKSIITRCDQMKSTDSIETISKDVTIKDVTDPTDRVKKKLDDYTENLKSVRNAVEHPTVNKRSTLIDTSLKKTRMRVDNLSATVNSTMVKTCSACKLSKNQFNFSKSQWKTKACDRRCSLCVKNNVPSTKGSDKYGQLTDTTSTWVEDVVRNEALKKTRTTLQPKLADWIDRISMDLKEEN
jgi:hypothetical protein